MGKYAGRIFTLSVNHLLYVVLVCLCKKQCICTRDGADLCAASFDSFLYGMLNFDFLHLGSASFWNTDAMLVLALVKIPLFIVLAILIYDNRKRY